MEFLSQTLSLGSECEEVSLLHKEVRAMGFDIPDSKASKASFGMGTRDAVAAFQNSNGLNPTTVANKETDELENRPSAVNFLIINGQVNHIDGTPFIGIIRVFDSSYG